MSGVKIEDIPPDDSQRLQTTARPLSYLHKKLVKVSPLNAISLDSVLKASITRTSATNTDLLKDHVFSDVEMDQNINKAIQMYEKAFSTRLRPANTKDTGVQIGKSPEMSRVLFITERRNVAVQCEDDQFRREAHSQTEDLPRRLIEVGVSAKPRYVETTVQAKPRTRDFGASDSTINDVVCDKCNVKKRNIGVGDRSVTNLLAAEETTFSLSNIGILQNRPPDHTSAGTKKEVVTRSIACGTRTNTVVSRGTDTGDLSSGKCRDFGVNTSKRKLVDAAVGDDARRRNSGCGVFLCDKCDVAIQNVAKDILTQNSDSTNPSPSVAVSSPTTNILKTSPSATISRIPRPAPARADIYMSTATTLHSTVIAKEKHRIQRQNTYTKLQAGAESRHTTTTTTQEKTRYAIQLSSVRCILIYFHGICSIVGYFF
jgi:hypothetical protein